MIAGLQTFLQRARQLHRQLRTDPRLHASLRIGFWLGAGFLLSAASLGNYPQTLTLGLVCASSGWQAVLVALGGCSGYWVFWGPGGHPGILMLALGLPLALGLGALPPAKLGKALLPALSSLIAAGVGLGWQLSTQAQTPVLIYLLQILMAGGCARVFADAAQDGPFARWLSWGAAVLALAQVAPLPWLGLGYLTCGLLCTGGPFPAAALGGLALDLAGITPVPMTAVACLAYFLRLLPWGRERLLWLGPPVMCAAVMALMDIWDPLPLLPLALGGWVGLLVPGRPRSGRRRGETGLAQVRLEMTAGVLNQFRQQLMDRPEPPLDEAALVRRSAQRACGSCPSRRQCPHREAAEAIPAQLLHKPLLDSTDLPLDCRRPGRLLEELHRAQEQLRSLRRQREQLRECRRALVQQYRFLSEYLLDTVDSLGSRAPGPKPRYRPEVVFAANRPKADNGDRCLRFSGIGCKYYVLLCDGMGTGLGAVEEGKYAAGILKALLTAGHPAQHALASLNSLYALQGMAGAATVDLAELRLDTGKVSLYKWGAPPSWLLAREGTEKIGTTGPPPGLWIEEGREQVERLSLRRGETLVLCSDGVGGEEALSRCLPEPDEPIGELAARILGTGDTGRTDDATVAAIRLCPDLTPT